MHDAFLYAYFKTLIPEAGAAAIEGPVDMP
jgi:hypothetical protein